jgi:hypothetical protein
MVVKIYIGDYKVDLFKEESISITSSVLDIEDITKNTTDYTKSFTVPATANNNSLFKHYYEANIDNTFDARIKIDGRIELDGMPFRKGKWLLQKVSVKKGNPSSYTINFWGNLVSISDSVGKDELNSKDTDGNFKIDLSAFNHSYDSDNVKLGLTGALFSGDIIYNLLVKKQYYYTTDLGDTTQTDSLANIHYNAIEYTGVIWNDVRPSLRLIRIIEAIESYYGITFSRDFFGRSEFTELYMWMNNEKGNKVGGNTIAVDFTSGDTTNVNLTTNICSVTSFNTSASNDEVYWQLALSVYSNISNVGKKITVITYNNDEILQEQELQLGSFFGAAITSSFTPFLRHETSGVPLTYNIRYEIKSDTEITFWTSLFQYRKGYLNQTYQTNGSSQTITSQFQGNNNLPKIKIIDFLKGIFQKYKLVVIPQEDGVIYVNTLKDYYLSGNMYDITEFIDWESYDVERGNILSEIKYNFQEPTTILNKQFKENTGIAYGDLEAILKDDNGEVLQGDTLTITLPFEQFVYERLSDLSNGNQTNIVYGAIVDDKVEPVNPKPHIFYNINLDLAGKQIGFINETGGREIINSTLNVPSHVNDIETKTFSTVFGNEYNEYDGVKIENTLYSNYHQQYINNVFNIKRRNFIFKCKNLPLRILMNLKLNDMLKIKDNYYRIDKFTTDLVTKETEFNLVNSFDYSLDGFFTNTSNIYLSKDVQSYSAYVSNLTLYDVVKIDSGSGTDWITVSDDGTNLIFTVIENTQLRRYIFINVTDSVTNQTIQFYINQEGVIVRADNTTMTADTNLITADYV